MEVASFIVSCGGQEYLDNLQTLKNLLTSWKSNKQILLLETVPGDQLIDEDPCSLTKDGKNTCDEHLNGEPNCMPTEGKVRSTDDQLDDDQCCLPTEGKVSSENNTGEK